MVLFQRHAPQLAHTHARKPITNSVSPSAESSVNPQDLITNTSENSDRTSHSSTADTSPNLMRIDNSLKGSSDSYTRRGRSKWSDWLGFYLPRYDGPHEVGTLTLELPIPEPYSTYELSSPMKSPNQEPILKLTNSLMTIFYPTLPKSKWSGRRGPEPRLRWINLEQIKGYLRFAQIRSWKRLVAIPLALLTMGMTRLPTRGCAPIAEGDARQKRRLVLFCHGLTGNRTCYSQLCGQLAARGYVVAAIEHRDGSGSHSVTNHVLGPGKTKRSCDVPYVDMSDISPDTRPDHYLYARAYQLELRTVELLAASKLLSQLAVPQGWRAVREANLRVRGSAGWAGDDGMMWDEQEWERFAKAVSWNEDVVATGHSFGGATVLACARHPHRPKHWTQLVLYDPWLETLDHWPSGAPKLRGGDSSTSTELPCLVINSPGFTDWPEHFEPLKRLVNTSPQSWLVTIGGIIHSSFSDLPILVERLWRMVGRLKLDSQVALDLIVRGSIEFLESRPNVIMDHQSEAIEDLNRPMELEPGKVHVHLKPEKQA